MYRARDRRLHREVALKILPELFAVDPERVVLNWVEELKQRVSAR